MSSEAKSGNFRSFRNYNSIELPVLPLNNLKYFPRKMGEITVKWTTVLIDLVTLSTGKIFLSFI